MRSLLPVTVVAALLLCAGCGDTHESLAAETMSTNKELATTLETVKDEASAKSAKDKLKSLATKMKDINARQAKLAMPTEAEVKAMDEKYGKEMEELQMKMMQNLMRIGFDPKIQAVLSDIDLKS